MQAQSTEKNAVAWPVAGLMDEASAAPVAVERCDTGSRSDVSSSNATSEQIALLRELVRLQRETVHELRGMRRVLRSRNESVPALIAALTDFFGPSRFTTQGVAQIADEEPHSAIALALADLVDMNASARSRATAIGALLTRSPEIEVVAESRGCAVYRLRTCPE